MDPINTLVFIQKVLESVTVAATPENARKLCAIYDAIAATTENELKEEAVDNV